MTDISLWTECYSLLDAVLVSKHPDKAGHFMAYLRIIVRASRNYEDTACASYDAAYRSKAANKRSLDWGFIDTALFSEAFTGRAELLPRCQFCLSETHRNSECPYGPGEDLRPPSKFPRLSTPSSTQSLRCPSGTVEICGKFNQTDGNNCTFQACRYAHVCAKCGRGPHPASECLSHTRGRGYSKGIPPLLNTPSRGQ